MKNKLPPLKVPISLTNRDLLIALILQVQALQASIFLTYKHLQENPAWPKAKDFDALYKECYVAAHKDVQNALRKLVQGKH
jgi:predicted outer membrane protein